jgi:hypothetical protein
MSPQKDKNVARKRSKCGTVAPGRDRCNGLNGHGIDSLAKQWNATI